MDTAEELRMNLASLQRIDPYIANINKIRPDSKFPTFGGFQKV